MKLYYTKGACSLVSRIIINELKQRCNYISVDLHTEKTEDEKDFLKINPKGAVPTLITDNNEVLTENAVIIQYLADQNNATTLLPKIPDFQRYRVLEWVNFAATDLHKNLGILFNPSITSEMKDTIFFPLILKKLKY